MIATRLGAAPAHAAIGTYLRRIGAQETEACQRCSAEDTMLCLIAGTGGSKGNECTYMYIRGFLRCYKDRCRWKMSQRYESWGWMKRQGAWYSSLGKRRYDSRGMMRTGRWMGIKDLDLNEAEWSKNSILVCYHIYRRQDPRVCTATWKPWP